MIWDAKEQSEISKSKGKELIQKSSQTLGECGCVVVWKKDCQLHVAADWAGVLILATPSDYSNGPGNKARHDFSWTTGLKRFAGRLIDLLHAQPTYICLLH